MIAPIDPIAASVLTGDIAWVQAAPGVRRAVLVTRPELMLVAFRLDAGAVGAPHAHPHVQAARPPRSHGSDRHSP